MMIKIILEIVALLAIGWVAGAEIGSWFGIQPIVGRLSYEQRVDLEQASRCRYRVSFFCPE